MGLTRTKFEQKFNRENTQQLQKKSQKKKIGRIFILRFKVAFLLPFTNFENPLKYAILAKHDLKTSRHFFHVYSW